MSDTLSASNNKGITLIEVLVAFVILAMSVTVLLRIFSSGTTNIIISQQYVDAVQVAEMQLASVGMERELAPATEYGLLAGKYNWQLTIEPYTFYEDDEQEQYPVSAFRILVEVSWVERAHTRRITLSSIKLKKNKTTSFRSG
jgi:general secretion pathway protein I